MISASLVKELRDRTGAGMMDAKKALEQTEGNIEKAIDYLRENGMVKAAKKESRIAAEGLAKIFIKDNKAVVIEVNSETDFVSKNTEFQAMIDDIGNAILNSDVTDVNGALELKSEEGTINDLIIAKTSKIGEKLSLRRIEVITKEDNENFGEYLHMGGKIATLVVVEGANVDVAKDVAMQAAAMKPEYVFSTEVPEDVINREKEVFKEMAIKEGKPEEIAIKMVDGRIKKYFKEICLADQDFIKESGISVEKYVTNNGGVLKSMVRYEVGEGMEKRNDDFASEVMNQVGK